MTSLATTYSVATVAIANHAATTIQAKTSRPRVTLTGLLVSWSPEAPAGTRARELAFLQYHLSVHQHVLDADRSLVRLLERRAIDHRRRIEDRDIRVHSRFHEAAIGQSDPLRRERRHLPHCELEGHEFLVAHVPAQDACKGAVGPRVRAVLAKWTVGRDAAGVSVHGHPPLLHRRPYVRLAHEEVDRPAARVIGDDQIEHRLDWIPVALRRDLGEALPLQVMKGVLEREHDDALRPLGRTV